MRTRSKNPHQARHLAQMKEELGLSQKQIADACSQLSQQRVSLILKGEADLQEYQAQDLAKSFPPYRAEWLMGFDEYPTESDFIAAQQRKEMQAADRASMDMHSLLMKLAIRAGYVFMIDTTKYGDADEDLTIKEGWTSFSVFRRGDRGSTELSAKEVQEIERQIIAFTEFQFWKVMSEPSHKEEIERKRNQPSITDYMSEEEKQELRDFFFPKRGESNGKE